MTLPTGTISMSQVNTELGRSATASINLNEAAVRSLAGVASGTISMNNLRGKSNYISQHSIVVGGYNPDPNDNESGYYRRGLIRNEYGTTGDPEYAPLVQSITPNIASIPGYSNAQIYIFELTYSGVYNPSLVVPGYLLYMDPYPNSGTVTNSGWTTVTLVGAGGTLALQRTSATFYSGGFSYGQWSWGRADGFNVFGDTRGTTTTVTFT